MDGNERNSETWASAAAEVRTWHGGRDVLMSAVCGDCGDDAVIVPDGKAQCEACMERARTMRVLWRRWLMFLALLLMDLGLAWSVRDVPLFPW